MQQITSEKSPKNDKSSIKSTSPHMELVNSHEKAKVEMGKTMVLQFETPSSVIVFLIFFLC